jgi:predicted nucleic acid-binding protein
MTFDAVLPGQAIFVDGNILIYYFTAQLTLIGIDVLSVAKRHVSLAPDISRQTGLLCGDALIVAVMQSHGLTLLASEDSDFDRVPGISRYGPQ